MGHCVLQQGFLRSSLLPLAGWRTPGKRAGGPQSAPHCNWANGGYSPRQFPAQNRPFDRPAHLPKALGGTMFITPAFAQSSPLSGLFGGDSGGMITSLLPLILIVVIMYFLVLRPQQQRVKQHREMVKALRRGDTVITNGGLVGKVTKVVDDDQIEVEIADGVRIRQMRAMVSEVRAKGEPVKDESAKSAS
jgi:preprotein translocase subunit YajC